jgi:hypothetical protein
MPNITSIPRSTEPARLPDAPGQPQVRRFLAKAVLLAVPVLFFLIAFELRFTQANPSHFAVKKALLERQASRIEVLIMGSSHELTAIYPGELGRPAFNLASQSQSLYYDISLIRKYRASLPALKLVVLPISYFSLEYDLDDAPERWRSYHYKYFYSLPHQDWHHLFSSRNFSAYFLSSESFRARVLLGKAANAALEYDVWGGWTNRPRIEAMDADQLAAAAQATLRTHEGMMRPKHLAANLTRLQDIVRELRRDGVSVVFITTPVSRFYRDGINKDAYQRMQTAMRKLSASEGFPYRNYMFDGRFTDSDFADGDHLNSAGARKFTHLLRDEALGQ